MERELCLKEIRGGSEIMSESGSALSAEVPHNQSHGSVTLASFCRALKNATKR